MKSKSATNIISNIDIVLAYPQIPENIGLVARALKNTSFSNLCLVGPNLTQKSFDVAKRARDVVKNVKVFDDVGVAVAKSNFVIGTTRRSREFKFIQSLSDVKYFLVAMAHKSRISVLFGKENFGLSKEEMELCDSVVYIPAADDFPSYNLSTAVGIFCYELFTTINSLYGIGSLELAKRKEVMSLFSYIAEYISSRNDKRKTQSTLLSLQRIAMRASLTKNEVALLKSLLITKKKKGTQE